MKGPKAQMTHKYIRNVSCASGAPRFVKSLDPSKTDTKTPVNNNLRDLGNQFYFITEERDDAFCGG